MPLPPRCRQPHQFVVKREIVDNLRIMNDSMTPKLACVSSAPRDIPLEEREEEEEVKRQYPFYLGVFNTQ